jgi:hypothetical protein
VVGVEGEGKAAGNTAVSTKVAKSKLMEGRKQLSENVSSLALRSGAGKLQCQWFLMHIPFNYIVTRTLSQEIKPNE